MSGAVCLYACACVWSGDGVWCGVLVLIADTHTDLENVTDAGMKDFSAALASSSTITEVTLDGKF